MGPFSLTMSYVGYFCGKEDAGTLVQRYAHILPISKLRSLLISLLPDLYFPNMDLFPSKYQFPTGLLTLSLRLRNIILANVY